MATNQEWLKRIRRQINSKHSEAANYWDSLNEEWRGVVLHAASIAGTESFKPHLAKCDWCELYQRLDCRGMSQLRTGIQKARNVFNGFGSLSRDDFTRRTADRPAKAVVPARNSQPMVIAPHIVQALAAREQLRNQQEKQS